MALSATASKAVTLKVATAFNTAAFVQGKAANASSVTLTSNVTAGNMLIVGCENAPFNTAGASWRPPTDSVSTPFFLVDTYWLNFGAGTGNALWLWYGIAPSSAANTVTCNGGGVNAATAAELSNVQNFLDAHAVTIGSGATGSVTITSSSLTTLQANSLLYSGGFVYGGSNTAVVAPLVTCCTRADVQTDYGSQVVTTVTGYTESFTTASATDGHWVIDLLALRPASNGTTAPVTSGGAKSQIF
jgi:hypothetical protein